MLMIRLERIDGEYVLRIPTHAVAQHDLRDGQLLGADTAGQVTIDPSKVGGLDLRLVDR